ncbi:DUF4440 domain-containing protein [Arthrobacter sp. ISL-48]|uniref:nuclear transport factor 2 family protein n=1 Tax=Arthrobacter sp. ISL-48 TaxID=2819110 RepID=UPI001BEBC7C1|nr:nuclear transport factor 2 family protein [Arthrobacter sp. ISL-48]MBT2533832.1 DUF4440 domain-containing protein [Arthrobacter sp. ISL-48]
MSGSDLDLAVEHYHQALDAFVMGDAAPQKKMFSTRDDVTLANPLGPPARGRSEVEKTMDRAVSLLREGEPTRFERISAYAGPDLGYIVEIERTRAKVTTIFRLEDEGWKVIHRHADPITSPRPIETVVQT